MISAREAALSLSGAMRLARFDAKGTYFFNASVAGFWNSFWAAAVIAPLHLIVLALLWQTRETTTSLGHFLTIGMLSSAISWFGFLLAMYYIARFAGRTHRYLAYAIATNWTSLFIVALAAPVQIAELTGVLSGDGLALALSVSFLYQFVLPWFVARHALNLSAYAAIAVVALDLFITSLMTTATSPIMFAG